MAIYDEHYFTPEYRNLPGVFRSSEVAVADVSHFLQEAIHETNFRAIAERQHRIVAQTFRREIYRNNIQTFYATYYPEWVPAEHQLAK